MSWIQFSDEQVTNEVSVVSVEFPIATCVVMIYVVTYLVLYA